MASAQLKNQHLMWRAGFGPAAEGLGKFPHLNPAQLYSSLQQASAQPPLAIDVADDYLKGLLLDADTAQRAQPVDAEKRRMIQQKQRQALRQLNLAWMDEMVSSKAQLREKMALFWHGHFACRNNNIFYQQHLLHVLRTHALGSFRTLLHEVSKSAAMLQFLNAAQNRKGNPNENFAREVMELFTMGRGQYTEKDIKEAARAFTGWSHTPKGEFLLRKFQHDDEAKTIFGKTANYTGEEVLDLLLQQKSTAQFLTKKIYRAFVNEEVDTGKIAQLADRFYNSNYNIEALMKDIFTAGWFYQEKHIGSKIKSPVELMVGLQRMLPLQKKESLLLMQRLLGQVLFYPPNVAGWPGGKSWIDSTTLVTRMRLPQLLYNADPFNLQPKEDDDQMMGKREMPNSTNKTGTDYAQALPQIVNWTPYVKGFENISRTQLLQSMGDTLLQSSQQINAAILAPYIDNSSRENFIKSATLRIMSLPEYQVC